MKKHTRASRTLKLGNIYIMFYNDHFRTPHWVDPDDPSTKTPVTLKAIGKLTAITPTQYNLEYAVEHASNGHVISAIMKPCVTKVYDLGPDPSSKRSK